MRLEFYENAADFLYVVVLANHVLVAQDIAKAQVAGFTLGFGAGVKRPIFGPQLLGRITGHPKRLLVDHSASPRENFTVVGTVPKRETRNPAAIVMQFEGRSISG